MKKICVILSCALLLQGCATQPQTPPEPTIRPLVTMITVSPGGAVQAQQRRYTSEKKMGYILTVLRLLEQEGHPAKVQGNPSDDLQIRLHLADGQEKTYSLRDGMYLSRDGVLWHEIEPSRGKLLEQLVTQLPEDSG